MIKRLAALAIITVTLVLLILYSQFRSEPKRVSGFIEADEIRVGSRLGGRVKRVHVQEGERVEEGEVLVELEPYDLLEREMEARHQLAARTAEYQRLKSGLREEEIEQAKARYEQANAQLALLEAGARPEEIEASKGRLQVAEIQLRRARQEYERLSELVEESAVSRQEFDRAAEALDSAMATVTIRKNELELLQKGAREQEIERAEARVEEARLAWRLAAKGNREEVIAKAKATQEAAEAALRAILEQKTELSIKSPLDGVVEASDLQAGDLVAPGAPVLSLLDPNNLWVRAYVPQNRVNLKVGQTLEVTVLDQNYRGKVVFISRQAEFTPSNVQTLEERSKQVFRIKVRLDVGTDELRPGMTVDVWLDGAGEGK